MQSNKSAQEILDEFKLLRTSTLNVDEFYNAYLQSCTYLCKSYFSIILENDDFEKKYSFNNPSDIFIKKAKELCIKAKKQGFSYERYEALDTNYKTPYVVVFKNFEQNSYVALLLDKTIQNQFNETLIRTQLISDVPNSYFKNLENDKINTSLVPIKENIISSDFNEYQDPLEIFNIVIHKDDYNLAHLTLVNELAFRFNCSQVSIGWLETSKVITKAISSVESFEKNSDTINLLENLFDETALQEEILIYPNSDKSLALYESEVYFKHRKISQLVSIPIFFKEKVCGVIVCEMHENELSQSDINTISLCANQISPWIINLQHKQESIFKKSSRKFISFAENTLSVKYTGLKLILASLLLILISSLLIKVDYKVDGIASIETDFVTYISAPYDSVIEKVNIKEGDDVLKNDLLLTLDINELKLKANESNANILRYSQEAEKARATNALADMKISLSKKQEAQISLDRVNYYITQSKIKAPYDGIVVEGDQTKLLGSPVSKGDVILKIAKLGSMYLKIKIKERDIDNIQNSGEFIFLSRPGVTYTIKVDKIIPIAQVDKSEGNVFIIKAFITEEEQSWWRPGMSGVTKLDAGEKTIFWISTHKLVDFLRIYLWW